MHILLATFVYYLAGSVIAGFLGRTVGWYTEGQPAGWIASILGAVLLLVIYRALAGRATPGGRIDRAA